MEKENHHREERHVSAKNLENLGFTVLEHVKGSHEHDVYIVEKEGKKQVVKASIESAKKEHIANQVEAESFMRTLLDEDMGISIPEGEYVEEGDVGFGTFEYVEGQAVSDLDNHVEQLLSEEEIDRVIELYTRLRQVKIEDLPERMKKQGEELFTDKNWRLKLQAHLDSIPENIVSTKQREQIFQNLDNVGYHQSLQHHDIVPWNMIRKEDGDLVVMDAEYARWGARHYDIAYYYIQNIVYLKDSEHAKMYLKKVVEEMEVRFPEDDIRKEIMYPMTYRIIVNVNESQGKSLEEQKAANDLFEKILLNDFSELI